MIATLKLSLLILLAGEAEPSPLAKFQLHNREARAARERSDHAAYLRHVRVVQSLLPGNASVRYSLARAYALNGHRDSAVAELATLARQGFAYRVLEEPAFAGMAGQEAFRKVAAELLANGPGEGAARLESLKLPDEMRGEAITWSPASRSFLLGGEGGVHSLAPDGGSSRLLGRWDAQVLGIRADPATATFLTCVNHEEAGTSQVARHRLSDGALLATYPLPAAGALCNDIALLPDGGFAVTDSNNSLVFRLEGGRLAPLSFSRPIFLPNGIAADPASGRLFVADANGILVHDIAAGASWHLEPEATSIAGIDGMIWHKGALVGVQNQTIPARLLRIRPDSAARRAEVAVLLADPAVGNSATVAAMDDEAFVYSRSRDEGAQDQPRLLRVRL
ncbi:MAG TPA: hypothetical protein VD846_12605 [Allosphingosinicella sp.]|nr:hypothetical protein [Allosphingosinicella sp.]